MSTNISPNPQLINLVKFGVVPSMITSIAFSFFGIGGIYYFYGEYKKTPDQSQLLLIIGSLFIWTILAISLSVYNYKMLKINSKDISVKIHKNSQK